MPHHASSPPTPVGPRQACASSTTTTLAERLPASVQSSITVTACADLPRQLRHLLHLFRRDRRPAQGNGGHAHGIQRNHIIRPLYDDETQSTESLRTPSCLQPVLPESSKPRSKPFTKWYFSGSFPCLPPTIHSCCFPSYSGSRPNHVSTSPLSETSDIRSSPASCRRVVAARVSWQVSHSPFPAHLRCQERPVAEVARRLRAHARPDRR